MKYIVSFLMFLAVSSNLGAEPTRFYNYEGFSNFLDGDAHMAALTADGQITLSHPVKKLVASLPHGRVIASTVGEDKLALVVASDKQRLLVIDQNGKQTDWGELPKGFTIALAFGSDSIYVSMLGPGRIYRYTAPGKYEAIALPKVTGKDATQSQEVGGVWALSETQQGLLMLTSMPGALYQYQQGKTGGTYVELFKSHEEILRSMAFDGKNNLYIGGGSKGIIYRGSLKGPFTAIYDTNLDEVTALLPQDNGELFLIGLASGGNDLKVTKTADAKALEKGKIRSQLVHFNQDAFAEVLAASDDEVLYALTQDSDGSILVATGSVDKENLRGRVYASKPRTREISLLYQAPSSQIVNISKRKQGGVLMLLNDPGSVQVLESGYAQEGTFTLPIFDAYAQARFGALLLEGETPEGCSLAAQMRVGQTAKPDQTWSPWSKELPIGVSQPQVINGRFVQARVMLRGKGRASPVARKLRLTYTRQNIAPFVDEIIFLPKGVALASLPADSVRERTFTLNDKGLAELRRLDDASAAEQPRVKQTFSPGMVTITWNVHDVNNDVLSYDLYFRRMGDKSFKPLQMDLRVPYYSFESASMANGRYQFKVVAHDDLSNPPNHGKQTTRESTWLVIDNTPPWIGTIQVGKNRTLSFQAGDEHSIVVRAEFSVDGLPLRPLVSTDGILDSQKESFELVLPESKSENKATAGPHVVNIRVEDEYGNVGNKEVTVP